MRLVVDGPGVSMELCGGIHVAGPAVLSYLMERVAVVKPLAVRFKAQPGPKPAP